MIQNILIELFERDLQRLAEEISAYEDESKLWELKGEVKNTAGNLCLHLVGNLNHFIGHLLGGSNYKRKRELEFSAKNIPRENLLEAIEQTKAIVSSSIKKLSNEDLDQNFPVQVFQRDHSVLHFLMHLSTHLNYHLGQINYHRRLL